VSRGGTWQGIRVTDPRSSTAGGGAFIALGSLGGAAIGFLLGEATPGFLIGLTTGVALSVAVWLRGRR
jgi:hypothetical protein